MGIKYVVIYILNRHLLVWFSILTLAVIISTALVKYHCDGNKELLLVMLSFFGFAKYNKNALQCAMNRV